MKASELRIGNFVNQGIYGVEEVSGYNLYQLTVKENGGNIAEYYNDWKPIPLTEEWLLKFGFIKDRGFYYKTKKGGQQVFIEKTINGFKFDYSYYHFCFFQYVHQLQNLYFALTGEELEIKENDNKS